MSRPSIIVDNLGKSYQIGRKAVKFPTLRDAAVAALASPMRRFRGLGRSPVDNNTFWAVRHVGFEVQPGEVVGIIGRNGAGKSTLLKMLSRITEPTEGIARLRGRVASLLEVGTGFHPELTGRENIYLNGSILGMRKSEISRKFDEIVAFAEIEKFLETPVKRYSSGMYVRLAFAVAAHLEPEILVVDEVLAVGDAEFQKKCLGKMQEVSRGGGRTVLFVSHNIGAVRSLCTTCCALDRGALRYQGDVSSGIESYMRSQTSSDTQPSRTFDPPQDAEAWMLSANLSSDGKIKTYVAMGDELSLSVRFSATVPLRFPKLGFTIDNADGHRVFNINNRYQSGAELEAPCTDGVITCNLGMVPLLPGHYTISLWFGSPTGDSHIEQDALTFEVIEQDNWGFSRLPPRGFSLLWWPAQFQAYSSSITADCQNARARDASSN